MLAAYNDDLLQSEIVDNIVEAINIRLSNSNMSLKQLSEATKIDYSALRNIVNKKSTPTLKILSKISLALDIYPHELLSSSHNPQEIPIIEKSEIETFSIDKTYTNKMRINEFIHPHAFAIQDKNYDFIIPTEITYVCYKNEINIFHINQIYVVKIINNIEIIKINKISNNIITYTCSSSSSSSSSKEDIIYLGTVVSMSMAEKLI